MSNGLKCVNKYLSQASFPAWVDLIDGGQCKIVPNESNKNNGLKL